MHIVMLLLHGEETESSCLLIIYRDLQVHPDVYVSTYVRQAHGRSLSGAGRGLSPQ